MIDARGPTRPGLPHVPALDGLRGLALVAVLVYHAEPSWLPGGMLSVTVFFTLSGFLITSLLLTELELTGAVDLPAFWMRRARRLVPASIAAVGLVALLAATGLHGAASSLIGDATSALTWSANWRFVADGSTYDSLFGDPSPLQHFWSLAVEEQVYLGLPLAALVLLRRARRRRSFAAVVVAGIAASTWAAAALHVAGATGGRAYYGTDARLAEPLVGALLAVCITRGGRFTAFGRAARRVAGAAGCLALAGLAALFAHLSIADGRLYRGGFLLTAALSAFVLIAATQDTVVARILRVRLLTRLGLISYGAYLFHWPIFLWVNDRLRGSDRIVVAAVGIGGTLALAVASHVLLELPIRSRHRSPRQIFTVGWAGASVAALAVMALVAVPPAGRGGSVEAVDLGVGVDDPVPPPPSIVAPSVPSLPAAPAPRLTPGELAAAPTPAPTPGPAPLTPEEAAILTGGDEASDSGGDPPAAGGGQLRVAVVGDSLAHNLATGLKAWAEERTDVVVYDLSVSFCPLSRGGDRRWEDGGEPFRVAAGCSWWDDPSSERSQNLAAFAPEVIVAEAGFSEMLDRRPPAAGRWLRPGDRDYHEWLLEEYGAMADTLRSTAATDVAFATLNVPCGDYGRQRGWRRVSDPDGRVRALDRGVYPFLEGGQRGDLDGQLCPNGQYTDELWGIPDARPDGMHLSDEAAAELARRWLGPLVLETAGRSGPGTVLEPAAGR